MAMKIWTTMAKSPMPSLRAKTLKVNPGILLSPLDTIKTRTKFLNDHYFCLKTEQIKSRRRKFIFIFTYSLLVRSLCKFAFPASFSLHKL